MPTPNRAREPRRYWCRPSTSAARVTHRSRRSQRNSSPHVPTAPSATSTTTACRRSERPAACGLARALSRKRRSCHQTSTTMIAQDPDIPKPLGIVERLREIQHRLGWISDEEMRLLAADFAAHGQTVPLHRIHEVASFYPMYRLKPPPSVDVRVCRDMA